jgi:hypothetical protein
MDLWTSAACIPRCPYDLWMEGGRAPVDPPSVVDVRTVVHQDGLGGSSMAHPHDGHT